MAQDTMTQNDSGPSTVTLIKGIIHDLERLTKQQLKMFKSELKEEVTELQTGTIALAISLGACLVSGVLLGIAIASILVSALELPSWVSFAIVGLAVGGLGAGLYFFGQSKIQSATPLVDESTDALEENIECLTQPNECATRSN